MNFSSFHIKRYDIYVVLKVLPYTPIKKVNNFSVIFVNKDQITFMISSKTLGYGNLHL